MSDLNMLQWTFVSECPIPNDVKSLMVTDEIAVVA